MGLVIGRSASRNASVQANTIEHILIGDKEYEPKTVGAKKNAVCLPDNPYELRQGEGHDEAYDLLGSFLASAYQASVAGGTSKGIELTSDQQDALDDLMTLPSLIHYPDQSNEGLFFCFGDPGHRVTIICIPGAYVIGKLQHNLSAITITIDDYRYAKVCLNTLSTLAKNGDGTKFLNDKGEYADPVAGYLRADALETFTDASELSVTCVSGRTRQGNNIATLAIGCSASDDSQAAEERIIFSTGPSVEGITVTGVSWANGDTPSFKANKVYEISVSYIPLLGKFLATYAEY